MGDSKKRITMKPRSDWRDWSALPRNVLFDITDRFTAIDDYVRSGAVCVSWRSILIKDNNSNNQKRHCSQPFLLVSSPDVDKHQLVMYSLSRKKIYEFDLHLPDNNSFSRVSSLGWLVTMEIIDNRHYNVHLQNPFLPHDRAIRLPPLDNVIQQHAHFDPRTSAVHFCKAALSSDPLSSNEFVLVAIINRCRGLAFFTSGNNAWTGEWREEWKQYKKFVDVIFSHRAKQFYALRFEGEVFAINLADLQQGVLNLIQLVPSINLTHRFVDDTIAGPNMAYLVEDLSSGELLQIHRYRNDLINSYYFVLFKLDRIEKSWNRIHDLTDKVMFLSNNTSVVRSVTDCPGCKPNCIYYTEDNVLAYRYKQRYGPRFDGIYSFEDNAVLPHYSTTPVLGKIAAPPIWIEPTLVYS